RSSRAPRRTPGGACSRRRRPGSRTQFSRRRAWRSPRGRRRRLARPKWPRAPQLRRHMRARRNGTGSRANASSPPFDQIGPSSIARALDPIEGTQGAPHGRRRTPSAGSLLGSRCAARYPRVRADLRIQMPQVQEALRRAREDRRDAAVPALSRPEPRAAVLDDRRGQHVDDAREVPSDRARRRAISEAREGSRGRRVPQQLHQRAQRAGGASADEASRRRGPQADRGQQTDRGSQADEEPPREVGRQARRPRLIHCRIEKEALMRTCRWSFTTVILFALLAGCGKSPTTGDAANPSAQAPRTGDAGASSGVDLAAIDRSVQPGDDFFAYANGTWVRTTEIPADRSRIGTFQLLSEKAEQRTLDLLRDLGATQLAAGSNARKVADAYAAYMDEDAIERRGLAGLEPLLDAIAAVKSRADLARLLGDRLRADVDPINVTSFHTDHLFGLFVTQ